MKRFARMLRARRLVSRTLESSEFRAEYLDAETEESRTRREAALVGLRRKLAADGGATMQTRSRPWWIVVAPAAAAALLIGFVWWLGVGTAELTPFGESCLAVIESSLGGGSADDAVTAPIVAAGGEGLLAMLRRNDLSDERVQALGGNPLGTLRGTDDADLEDVRLVSPRAGTTESDPVFRFEAAEHDEPRVFVVELRGGPTWSEVLARERVTVPAGAEAWGEVRVSAIDWQPSALYEWSVTLAEDQPLAAEDVPDVATFRIVPEDARVSELPTTGRGSLDALVRASALLSEGLAFDAQQVLDDLTGEELTDAEVELLRWLRDAADTLLGTGGD